MSEGIKHDKGKLDWYALPLEILEPLAELLLAGEKKYSTFNCLEPFKDADRRFWSANMRHAAKCQQDPLAIDEETGCYHEAARAFCSLMRLYHARNGKFEELSCSIDTGDWPSDFPKNMELGKSTTTEWPRVEIRLKSGL